MRSIVFSFLFFSFINNCLSQDCIDSITVISGFKSIVEIKKLEMTPNGLGIRISIATEKGCKLIKELIQSKDEKGRLIFLNGEDEFFYKEGNKYFNMEGKLTFSEKDIKYGKVAALEPIYGHVIQKPWESEEEAITYYVYRIYDIKNPANSIYEYYNAKTDNVEIKDWFNERSFFDPLRYSVPLITIDLTGKEGKTINVPDENGVLKKEEDKIMVGRTIGGHRRYDGVDNVIKVYHAWRKMVEGNWWTIAEMKDFVKKSEETHIYSGREKWPEPYRINKVYHKGKVKKVVITCYDERGNKLFDLDRDTDEILTEYIESKRDKYLPIAIRELRALELYPDPEYLKRPEERKKIKLPAKLTFDLPERYPELYQIYLQIKRRQNLITGLVADQGDILRASTTNNAFCAWIGTLFGDYELTEKIFDFYKRNWDRRYELLYREYNPENGLPFQGGIFEIDSNSNLWLALSVFANRDKFMALKAEEAKDEIANWLASLTDEAKKESIENLIRLGREKDFMEQWLSNYFAAKTDEDRQDAIDEITRIFHPTMPDLTIEDFYWEHEEELSQIEAKTSEERAEAISDLAHKIIYDHHKGNLEYIKESEAPTVRRDRIEEYASIIAMWQYHTYLQFAISLVRNRLYELQVTQKLEDEAALSGGIRAGPKREAEQFDKLFEDNLALYLIYKIMRDDVYPSYMDNFGEALYEKLQNELRLYIEGVKYWLGENYNDTRGRLNMRESETYFDRMKTEAKFEYLMNYYDYGGAIVDDLAKLSPEDMGEYRRAYTEHLKAVEGFEMAYEEEIGWVQYLAITALGRDGLKKELGLSEVEIDGIADWAKHYETTAIPKGLSGIERYAVWRWQKDNPLY